MIENWTHKQKSYLNLARTDCSVDEDCSDSKCVCTGTKPHCGSSNTCVECRSDNQCTGRIATCKDGKCIQRKISAYLTQKVWNQGGEKQQESLESAIAAMGSEGTSVAQLFGDARRDYVQLFLANTYSLDNQAAINSDRNLAFRETSFTDQWNRHQGAWEVADKTFDMTKYVLETANDKNRVDVETSNAKKSAATERLRQRLRDAHSEQVNNFKQDVKTADERRRKISDLLRERKVGDNEIKAAKTRREKLKSWRIAANKFWDTTLGDKTDKLTKDITKRCDFFQAIFNPGIESPSGEQPTQTAELTIQQTHWATTKEYSKDIQESHDKCMNANTMWYENRRNIIKEWRAKEENKVPDEFQVDEKTARQSTSQDAYTPEDSVFDIMIRNNENLITALIGKTAGDGDNNLLKTVMDSLDKNAESIGAKLDDVQSGLGSFTRKLTSKFNAIKSWSTIISSHQHTSLPVGKFFLLLALFIDPFYAFFFFFFFLFKFKIFYSLGGPTTPLGPGVVLPWPPPSRTGPLGDGSPIFPNDTQLTLDWLDKLTTTLNLTEAEQEAYEALSLDKLNLVEMLIVICGTVESSDGVASDFKAAGESTGDHPLVKVSSLIRTLDRFSL